jgi:hypothetical protein
VLKKTAIASLAIATLTLAGCNEKPPLPEATPFEPTASIQELMQSIIDPSADALWESISSTTTASGTDNKQPQTEAEWIELRHLAIRLAESSNLLAIPGRPVAHPAKQLEDSHVKGMLSAAEIESRIVLDRASFIQRARQLQQAAQLSLAAIDARNVERFLEAGARIDQACEQCHLQYWYPNDRRPTSVPDNAARNPQLAPASKPHFTQ